MTALVGALVVTPAGATSAPGPGVPTVSPRAGLPAAAAPADPLLQAAADRAVAPVDGDAAAAACGPVQAIPDPAGDATPLDATTYGLADDCGTSPLVLVVDTGVAFAPSTLDFVAIDIDLPGLAVPGATGCEGFDAFVEGWYDPEVGLVASAWRMRECDGETWGYAGEAAVAVGPTGTVALAFEPGQFLRSAPTFGWAASIGGVGGQVDLLPAAGRHPFEPQPLTWDPVAGTVGYWMLGDNGIVHAFGDAPNWGINPNPSARAVDLEPTPDGGGYWLVGPTGFIAAFGGAAQLGMPPLLRAGESVTSISATPTGAGYWMFTDLGRAFAYGDARHHGDMDGVALNGAVLDSIPTPTGLGYYMVGEDGGIFAFGDAAFRGSMGGIPLNAPVQSLVPDPDGAGYWLVASDGGIFAFDAGFRGSMGGVPLNSPVSGMVPWGTGYLMVAEDGGIFSFSDLPFLGSLGDAPPPYPIVSIAALTV